ncbi:MAG TPA: crotonase/enoyl-CoA hydratase family protein [Hyphomicrobium sp.]|nr:crotonase/enoyl-CoA hydratase family protein [Hyphomicrobium sp.]
MTSEIVIARDNRVQVLRLSRPDKKNALTRAMYAALSDAIEQGDADPAIAAHVITGSGGIFTAGNDIGDFLASGLGDDDASTDVLRFIRLLPVIKKPLIAAVDGIAIGIGTTLLFHCDLVYATPAATFATPFLDLGLVPEAGSSLLMPRTMGYQRAFEMLVLGDPFSAERAREAGFVNAIVPTDAIEETAIKAATRLGAKPPEALELARDLLRGNAVDISRRVDEEAIAFAARLKSPEAREAFQAFLEKRPPRFSPESS